MISVIFCGDIKYCPYLNRYTERLEILGMDYEVLFWNRDGRTLQLPKNYFWYDKISPETLGRKKKLIDFYGFRKWTNARIKKNKSDGLILLSTLSAVMLFGHLRKYNRKYIFDIRDYSFENLALFRIIEKRIIKNSYFTAISSEGFKAFLPTYDYILAHNFNRKDLKTRTHFNKSVDTINFVWNGTVRYLGFQKQYIDALKNDDRYKITYHGSGMELKEFKAYVKKIGAKNVEFTGSYNNEDKPLLLENASVLNNCYGGNYGDALKYAVSNRFYDGLIYRIPQVVEPGG